MERRGIEREFMRIMRRFGRIKMSTTFQGISQSEFVVMASLDRYAKNHNGDGSSASMLAGMVDASPQALSRTLRGLEQKGFIVRKADHRDRRHVCICLTDAAYDVMEEKKRQLEKTFDQVVDRMGEDQMQELIILLNRLIDTMQSVNGQESDGQNETRQDKKENKDA